MPISVFDIVSFSFLAIAGIALGKIGFFAQLGSIAGHFLGGFFAIISLRSVIEFIESRLTVNIDPLIISLVGFVILYDMCFIFIKILSTTYSDAIKGTKFQIVDSTLGFILGVFISLGVLLIFIIFLQKQGLFDVEHWYSDSYFYKKVALPIVNIISKKTH